MDHSVHAFIYHSSGYFVKLNLRSISLLLMIVWFSVPAYSWGEKGHKLIAKKAFESLPGAMADFAAFRDLIVEHSVDPDNRKGADNSEKPKHFLDFDFYKEFKNGYVIRNIDSLKAHYGITEVTKQGTLPWVTLITFKALIRAFHSGNRDSIQLYGSDLAHYVADGFQPLHVCLNYDGKLTDQKGIHSRYESGLINAHLDNLDSLVHPGTAGGISDPESYVFDYLTASYDYSDLILAADKFATANQKPGDKGDYFRLLWFKTKYFTLQQVSNAAQALASFYYTAWTEAGKPALQAQMQGK